MTKAPTNLPGKVVTLDLLAIAESIAERTDIQCCVSAVCLRGGKLQKDSTLHQSAQL